MESTIEKIVKSVAKREGLQHIELGPIQTNDKGAGYMGKVYIASISGKHHNTVKQFNLIVKIAYMGEHVRKSLPIQIMFENEIYFYNSVYPELLKYDQTLVDLVPKCFITSATDDVDGIEYLVLDNLKYQGFDVFDKWLEMDQKQIEMIFRKYAHFHALSFALKHKDPKKFEEISGKIHNSFKEILCSTLLRNSNKQTFKTIYDSLVPGEDDAILENFRKYVDDPLEQVLPLLDVTDQYSVITHGDCWSNNMLFKFEESSRKPTALRLIDWQLLRVGNPMCDLSYALYSGASKEVFSNLNDCLRVYYDIFSSTFLQVAGCDVTALYPFDLMVAHWKIHAKYTLFLISPTLKAKLLRSADDAFDIEGGNFDNPENYAKKSSFDCETYNRKMKDILKHMNGIGAL